MGNDFVLEQLIDLLKVFFLSVDVLKKNILPLISTNFI